MPTYDYYSEETKETKEVFHAMNESPEVLDSQGNKMKKIISGGTGYILSKDSTRNRNYRSRYGHKKTENQSTPSESAALKAAQVSSEAKYNKKISKDPYSDFRK